MKVKKLTGVLVVAAACSLAACRPAPFATSPPGGAERPPVTASASISDGATVPGPSLDQAPQAMDGINRPAATAEELKGDRVMRIILTTLLVGAIAFITFKALVGD